MISDFGLSISFREWGTLVFIYNWDVGLVCGYKEDTFCFDFVVIKETPYGFGVW